MIKLGLRFRHRDADLLDALARRVATKDLGGEAHDVFKLAADAARTGEPLVLQCVDVQEAMITAAGYARFGVRPPAIEQLSGKL